MVRNSNRDSDRFIANGEYTCKYGTGTEDLLDLRAKCDSVVLEQQSVPCSSWKPALPPAGSLTAAR